MSTVDYGKYPMGSQLLGYFLKKNIDSYFVTCFVTGRRYSKFRKCGKEGENERTYIWQSVQNYNCLH